LPGLCPAKPTAIGGNYARLCRMLLLRRPENNAVAQKITLTTIVDCHKRIAQV
jgi:hypothetical protein